MKITEKQQSEQLGYLHQLYRDNLKMRATIKNWCVVVWSGIIVIILSQRFILLQQVPYPIKSLIALFFFIIFFFWLLEAIEGARTILYRDLFLKMENRIVNKKLENSRPKDFFVISAYQNISRCQKLCYFLRAFFGSETLFSFYFSLGLASGALIFAIKMWL